MTQTHSGLSSEPRVVAPPQHRAADLSQFWSLFQSPFANPWHFVDRSHFHEGLLNEVRPKFSITKSYAYAILVASSRQV